MTHCGTCKHHTFQGIENYCTVWKRIIPREKWDKKKADGSAVCSCSKYVDWESKSVEPVSPRQK